MGAERSDRGRRGSPDCGNPGKNAENQGFPEQQNPEFVPWHLGAEHEIFHGCGGIMETNQRPRTEPDGLTFTYQGNGKGTAATVTAKLAGEILACERFDLAKAKQRSEFAEMVCKGRPGILKKAVLDELLRLASVLADRGNGDSAEPAPKPEPLQTMPEAVRREATALLESPDLLQTVVQDIGRLGVAGETELAATVYLVGTSRLLKKPLAAIVQGPSASGKSYVVEKAASLFPPEAVILATQMTPQALFHMEPGSLRNRFVVAGERSRLENDDRAEATRALREMLSGGRLSKLMPVKEAGEIVTRTIEQEGPIAFVETTTLAQIFEEDSNRCVLLNTDERAGQTRRILDKLAAAYSGAVPEAEAARIVERHWAMQRSLQPCEIVVPYAERLASLLADEQVEIRRAFPHLISMVQACTLLHQRQRQVDEYGRLVAIPDDYQVARHLLTKPLGRLLGGRLSDPARRFLERLREWYGAGEEFTAHEATRKERASKSSTAGWIKELARAGFLNRTEEARGRAAAKWELAADGAEESAAYLPSYEQLFPEIGWTHGRKQEPQTE